MLQETLINLHINYIYKKKRIIWYIVFKSEYFDNIKKKIKFVLLKNKPLSGSRYLEFVSFQ